MIKMKVGTVKVESQALDLKGDSLGKIGRREENSEDKTEEECTEREQECHRDERIVVELMKIRYREMRITRNRIKKIAMDNIRKIKEKAKKEKSEAMVTEMVMMVPDGTRWYL